MAAKKDILSTKIRKWLESPEGQDVLIKGCGGVPIPTWAAMMITAHIAQVASSIAYGEEARPLTIFERAVQPSA